MRRFLVLCLIAVAGSERLGYNYSPSSRSGERSYSSGNGHSRALIGGLSTGGSYSSGFAVSSGSGLNSASLSSGSYDNGGGHNNGNLGGGVGSGAYSGSGGINNGGGSYNSGAVSAQAPIVTKLHKEFYFHSAPEEVHDGSNSQNVQTTLKKNLRVIFIKAPESSGVRNAALQIARQASEDQTAIYVLTKQTDASDISQQIQQLSEAHSQKPEVHFVKYRTQEDALNAQRAIQAQYDSLGGSSKSSNEGLAPVLNYASSNQVGNRRGSAANNPVANYQGSASSNSVANSQRSPSSSLNGSYQGSVSQSSVRITPAIVTAGAPPLSYVSPKSSYLPPVVV